MKKILFLLLALTMTILVLSTEIFYTVGFDDTLYSISKRINIPLNRIIEKNDLKEPYTIKPGQKLKINEVQERDFDFIFSKPNDKIIELFFNHFYQIAHHNFEYEIREDFMYNLTKLLYDNGYNKFADSTISLIVDQNHKEKALLLKSFTAVKRNNIHSLLKQLNEINNEDIKRNLEYTLSDLLLKSGYTEIAIDFRKRSVGKDSKKIILNQLSYKNNDFYLIKKLINNNEYESSFQIFSNNILTENLSPEKLLSVMDIFIEMINNEFIINNHREDFNKILVISWLMI
ncbi:LysM peptidoglycan-binding domain-containing protein [Geotoga petraea]|uniref:LysM domain-containing protein n=1 Tax=Geotoga petraea TaxID=28234 RepID=A0A1G6KN91_9BACT|nr:LysM peptidoglycan-binding domain-containing protein [Geotoga petraea]SDC32572.1 LysM domain-containing protein [Geotoga petraea]